MSSTPQLNRSGAGAISSDEHRSPSATVLPSLSLIGFGLYLLGFIDLNSIQVHWCYCSFFLNMIILLYVASYCGLGLLFPQLPPSLGWILNLDTVLFLFLLFGFCKKVQSFWGLLKHWFGGIQDIWNQKLYDPFSSSQWKLQPSQVELMNLSKLMDTDYGILHYPKGQRGTRVGARWECPPSGRLTLNVDGSFVKHQGISDVGIVVRDEEGCVHVVVQPLQFVHSLLHAKAEVLRTGLMLGFGQCWNHIDIESVSCYLVAAITEEHDIIEVNHVLAECRQLLKGFYLVHIRHIGHKANGAADRIAHLARLGFYDHVWVGETPAFLQDILQADLGFLPIVNRVSGFMSPPPRSLM